MARLQDEHMPGQHTSALVGLCQKCSNQFMQLVTCTPTGFAGIASPHHIFIKHQVVLKTVMARNPLSGAPKSELSYGWRN
jgi:hypothetical protein